MRIVEIKALPNGAHRNQISGTMRVPDGWAVIPDSLNCPNFPFGEVEAEEIGGVMTVTRWTAGELPTPEPGEPEADTEDTEASVWDELDAAYREGVESV